MSAKKANPKRPARWYLDRLIDKVKRRTQQ